MTWTSAGAVVALLLSLAGPVMADHADGFDNNGNGLTDEEAENNHGGAQPGGLQGECIATSRPEICLTYFQFNCQTYGFPMACSLASLGANCNGGDPGQCQYFMGLLRANTACFYGDQNACVYLSQQGVTG